MHKPYFNIITKLFVYFDFIVISGEIIKIYAKYEKNFYLIDIIGLNEYNFRHNFLVLYEPFPQVKTLKALYDRIEKKYFY